MVPLALKRAMRAADWLSPRLAGELAYWLFHFPPKSKPTTPEQQALIADAEQLFATGERKAVPFDGTQIVTYRIAAKGTRRGTALLIHGWTSRALHMARFAGRLQAAGFDVVCIDLPAHGQSPGRFTNAEEAAAGVRVVIAELGRVELMVGHSFGGAVISLALRAPAIAAAVADVRIVLVSSPNSLGYVTGEFGAALGLSMRAQAHFERRTCALLGLSLEEAEGNPACRAIDRPVLVVHCRDDQEIAFTEAEKWAQIPDLVTLRPVEGFGHRRILYAEPALDAVVAFAEA